MNVLLCRRQQNKYNIWYIIIYNSIKSSNKPSDINIIHKWVSEWVSEWVLLKVKWTIVQLYHGEVTFQWDVDDGDVKFVPDQHTKLDYNCVRSPKNSPRIDTLSWFRANQSFPFCNVLSGDATDNNFTVFGLTR
jgi:hypothetical protein